MSAPTAGPPADPPVEPCLVCAVNVFRPGAGTITQHRSRPGRALVGWTCGEEHAAMVEACRDDKGVLRARRSYTRPYRPRSAPSPASSPSSPSSSSPSSRKVTS